jgi:hypothetical protein
MGRVCRFGVAALGAALAIVRSAPGWAGETRTAVASQARFALDAQPQFDEVFPSKEGYRALIAQYQELSQQVERTRSEVGHSANTLVGLLRLTTTSCAARDLRGRYQQALAAESRLAELRARLAAVRSQIRDLDSLGETLALPLFDRLRVSRALRTGDLTLREGDELRLMLGQIEGEIQRLRCTYGPEEAPGRRNRTAARPRPPERSAGIQATGARAGLVGIDNRGCRRAVAVDLDGSRLAVVPGGQRQLLPVAAGHHDLCLRPEPAIGTCDRGSIRRIHASAGMSLRVDCEEPPPPVAPASGPPLDS